MLGQGVASINAQIRPGDILGCVREEEGHSAHQVFRNTHLADGDEGDPFIAELGVFVEDLAGAAQKIIESVHVTEVGESPLTGQSACSQG